MAGRVIAAALIGGLLMFVCGFVEHALLHLVDRQFKAPANEATAGEAIKNHFPDPGAYSFPPMPKNYDTMTPADKEKFEAAMKDSYKNGPSAMIFLAPTGEDFEMGRLLGFEFASNLGATLLAALIVAMLRADAGFAGRWVTVFFIGLAAWLSVNASYFIWYRFPGPWVFDELLCSMMEWGVSGVAIAAIVRPRRGFPSGN